jgi:hypothetical protein
MGPQPWSVGEALSAGWNSLFWTHFWTLILTYVVSAVPGFAIGQISNQVSKGYVDPTDPLAAFQEPGYWAISFGFQIPVMIIAAFFQGGLIKIWLSVARGQTPNFVDLFGGGRTFLPILAFNFLTQLILLFSLPLLLVPWIVWLCGMALAQFFMVDENLGFMDALGKSWRMTSGQKGSMFLYGLVMIGVILLGFCACCIGVLAAYPIVMVGMALIYTRISGNTGMSGMPYGGMPPGPMQGYGPTQPQGGFGQPPGYGPPPGY